MAFAHLHVHSQFSLLDGAVPIKKLGPAAAELGQSAVALTDHCNLYGAVAFDKSCKGLIQPVFGSGLWWQPEGLAHTSDRKEQAAWHLVALIEDQQGYQNLCKLITAAIFDGMYYKPRIDSDQLAAHREGLMWLTSGARGPVKGPALEGRPEQASHHLEQLARLLGPEQLFVELQDVGLDGELEANRLARHEAGRLGLATVVTNGVHYLKPQDAPILDVLQCIGSGVSNNDDGRRRPFTDQLYLKSEAEMRALFPDDGAAVDRTVELAGRCSFAFDYKTYYFPASTPPDTAEGDDTDPNWDFFYRAFPPPRDFGLPTPEEGVPPRPHGAGNLDGYFEWYCREGLKLRLQRVPEAEHPAYWERLQVEIDIVESMGFPAYYLIVAEFINWAKDHDIPVGPGRGSAAGSLCAWATRITDIDPLRFDLLFERFLNPERVSMPDVDVDFCQDRREEVIEHTRQKYGEDFVAQIITFGKLQAKNSVRDVSRILDMSFNDADRIAKLIPDELGIKLEAALQEEGLKNLFEQDPRVRRIINLARGVEGLTRQTGVHAAGVVVADRPLVELVPLYRLGPDGGPVVQFDMKSAESIGLIKFDFLGLKTLDQIRDAVVMIERNTGASIDMSALPEDDPATYELLSRGDGLGVFQVESSGMRELLPKLRPSVLEDVVALVALYRPGPLGSGMVDDFIDRKHGRKQVVYDLPELEPILRSTYGVILYQEQVMQIAQVLAGYSLGEADMLRRAMGKKIAAEMAKQRQRFVDGATAAGHPVKKAEGIFDLMAQFAAYGFNKSHSAAYGYITFQTAWLKANHRAEYMAALMSIESANTDKLLVYQGDCRHAGLEILAPDANQGGVGFDVRASNRSQIHYGLAALKNVGRSAVEALVDARAEAGGQFDDLMDCLERLDYTRINLRVLEQLVKGGAFDWTGHARAVLFTALDGAVSSAQSTQADKAAGQTSLFGMFAGGGGNASPPLRLPDVPEWSTSRRLAMEREALGFYMSGHPIEAFKSEVDRLCTGRIEGLVRRPHGSNVAIGGMPSAIRVVKTKRGDRMAFVTLEDDTGAVECVFFSEPWSQSQRALKADEPVLVRGQVEVRDGAKILAESVQLMSELRRERTRQVHLDLFHGDLDRRNIRALRKVLQRFPGKCRTELHVTFPGRSRVTLTLPEDLQVRAEEELVDEVATALRRQDVVRFG